MICAAVAASLLTSCGEEVKKESRTTSSAAEERGQSVVEEVKDDQVEANRKAAEERLANMPKPVNRSENSVPITEEEVRVVPKELTNVQGEFGGDQEVIIQKGDEKIRFTEMNPDGFQLKHYPGEPTGRLVFSCESRDKRNEIKFEIQGMELARSFERVNGQYLMEPANSHPFEIPQGSATIILTDDDVVFKKYIMIEGNIFIDSFSNELVLGHLEGAFRANGDEKAVLQVHFRITEVPESLF